MHVNREADYVAIRGYALIGDCHGSALVSDRGSVDWCCLHRFDADPTFCGLLDATRGGHFAIHPVDDASWSRRYVGPTAILETTCRTASGAVRILDFMPVGRTPAATLHDYVSLRAPYWLIRLVEGVEGAVSMTVFCRPSTEFARVRPVLRSVAGGAEAPNGPGIYADVNVRVDEDRVEGEFTIRAGDERVFVITDRPAPADRVLSDARRTLAVTRAFWEEWAAYARYSGPHREAVLRSAITLKLLTYAPSGALVAAPTTSLPEEIGGERNWDYRFCWLRDGTLMLYALAILGYSGEARRFAAYLYKACRATAPRVHIMYGIEHETELAERHLDHLEGYRGSRPVRVGNSAYSQAQLDVYGEVLEWASTYAALGGRIDGDLRHVAKLLGRTVMERWQDPDHGIWEIRGEPRQYVFGKILAWAALDRLNRLLGRDADRVAAMRAIERAVLEHGTDTSRSHLVQTFGSNDADAALLLAPGLGFPLPPHLFTGTVAFIRTQLGGGDYLRRYTADDALPGVEGAFLICSFWLVDAMLFAGQVDEARALFDRLCARANDVGLYAEEIGPATEEFLGNFPQAFTHLGLVHSASLFELVERHGPRALEGTAADRARRLVGATEGLRGVVAAFRKSGRIGRLFSSRASMLTGLDVAR